MKAGRPERLPPPSRFASLPWAGNSGKGLKAKAGEGSIRREMEVVEGEKKRRQRSLQRAGANLIFLYSSWACQYFWVMGSWEPGDCGKVQASGQFPWLLAFVWW